MKLETAFKEVIDKRGLLASLDYSHDKISNLRRNFKSGKVAVEMMRKVVKDAGYICVTEEDWEKK